MYVHTTGGTCSFSGNAGGMGGALFVGDGASMQISESVSFTGNKATLNGGAVLTSPKSSVTISGSNVSFAGNFARFGGQASFYGKVAIQVAALVVCMYVCMHICMCAYIRSQSIFLWQSDHSGSCIGCMYVCIHNAYTEHLFMAKWPFR
jgi:predicted outer membrane repeat protein